MQKCAAGAELRNLCFQTRIQNLFKPKVALDFAFRFNHFHIDLKILNSYMKNIIHRKQWMAQVILKFSFGCLLALFIKYKAKSGFYIYLDNISELSAEFVETSFQKPTSLNIFEFTQV